MTRRRRQSFQNPGGVFILGVFLGLLLLAAVYEACALVTGAIG